MIIYFSGTGNFRNTLWASPGYGGFDVRMANPAHCTKLDWEHIIYGRQFSDTLWKNTCTHCMACISRCPQEAIEYGEHSKGLPRHVCNKEIW